MEREHLYVLGVGDKGDWRAGRGSVHYIEDRNGEKVLPVFSSSERADEYRIANFGAPQSHMDMSESVPEPHAKSLTEGRFILMPLDAEGVAKAAVMVGAAYLVRDPRPGDAQEILRLT